MSVWPYEQTIRRNISFKGNQFFYSAGTPQDQHIQ